MDEPIEGGGSFDASGAFLGCEDKHLRGIYDRSNEDEFHKSDEITRHEREDSPSDSTEDKLGDDLIRSTNSDDGNAQHCLEENEKNKSDAQNFNSSKDVQNEKSNRNHEIVDKGSTDQKCDKAIVSSSLSPSPAGGSSGKTVHVAVNHDRMREVADDIEKLIMDDDLSCGENVTLQSDSLGGQKAHKSSVDDSIAEKVGENALSNAAVASDLWFYRDPQGKVQGPFTATEMLEWYRAGYFDENLYVKRNCDPQFMALGDLLKICSGTIPFVAAPYMPQLLQSNKGNDINLSSSNIVVSAAAPTKPLANHISHVSSLPVQMTANPTPPGNQLLDESIHHIHHPIQKHQFLRNQQALSIKSLAETEPWAILNAEQQAALIAQRMNQNHSPNDIMPAQGLNTGTSVNPIMNHLLSAAAAAAPSKAMPKLPNHHLGDLPATAAVINKQATALKNQQQTQSLQHLLNQHKKDENPNGHNVPVNMIHPAADPVQHMLHTINMQNQSQIAPAVENNPIKSLIMQLSMPKTMAAPPNMLPAHHHLQQPSHMQLPHENRMPIPQTHNVHGLWEIPMPSSLAGTPNEPNLHNNLMPSAAMKTEMHILEQHLHAKAKEEQMKRDHVTAQQIDQWKKHHSQEIQKSLMSQKEVGGGNFMVPPLQSMQQQQQQAPLIHHEPQQSIPSELIHQSDMFKMRNENFTDEHIAVIEATKAMAVDKTNAKIKSDAKHNQNQSSPHVNDNDNVRNNNPIVANKSTTNKSLEKLKQDEENDKFIDIGKSNKTNKNTPATAATSKQTPIEIKNPIQKIALNNNNAQTQQQQQQNGTQDNSHSILTNNNIKTSASATAAINAAKLAATTKENSTKKKSKDKDLRLAEEKKRQQEEEERQSLEEKKRLELIAAQRKAKLVDQNLAAASARNDVNGKRNNMAASVAPWSNLGDVAATNVVTSPLNFAEIQKAERERRAELYRMEQSLREQQTQAILEQQQQKDAVLKWKLKPQANQIKSLAEIQAEESKARQSNFQQVSTTNVSFPNVD